MAELREKIVAHIIARDSITAVAEKFNVTRKTVHSSWKLYEETGDYKQRRGGPRPRSGCSEALVESVKTKIKENPSTSIRTLARDFSLPETTMRRLVKVDLGLKSLAKTKVQQLTPVKRSKRESRGQKMLNLLHQETVGCVLVFSDKKDFHVDQFLNRRNDRYLATSTKDTDLSIRYVGASKFPDKKMMFGYIGSDGTAFPPIWIEGNMDGLMYKNIMARKVIPTVERTYGKDKFVLVQDGASCHTSKVIQGYLSRRLGSRGFWSKTVWLPNLLNLNPMDFSIWNQVEAAARATPHSNVASLMSAMEVA